MATRKIKMTPEVERALKEQRQAFVEKFGREPGPGDPVFFDPDAETPMPLSDSTMRRILREESR